jgi:hypothetical protein
MITIEKIEKIKIINNNLIVLSKNPRLKVEGFYLLTYKKKPAFINWFFTYLKYF